MIKPPMTPLNQYLLAILGQTSTVTLVDQSHSREQQTAPDGLIHTRQSHYRFHDGAVIQEEREDFYPSTDASHSRAATCPPCELAYQVIAHGHTMVTPAYKRFRNECQRSFWIEAFHLPT